MSQLSILFQPPPAECFRDDCGRESRGQRENGVIGEFAPAFEVSETSRELRIQADVPGVALRDLAVFVVGGHMLIWGERKRAELPKDLQFHAYERTYGRFWRTFRPTHDCDLHHMQANVRHGVLTVRVPKQSHSARSADLSATGA